METEMITLEINGRSVTVPKGTTILNAAKCRGCTMCAKKCPAGAISGELKNPHVIDQSKCVKCGACEATCKFGAISHG